MTSFQLEQGLPSVVK